MSCQRSIPWRHDTWRTNEDCSRDRCLGTASQRRRADTDVHRAGASFHGSLCGAPHATGVPHAALPELSGYSPVTVPGRQGHASSHRLRSRCHSHRHGRPPGNCGAAVCHGAGLAVHDRLPHSLPRIRSCAHRHAAFVDVCFPALVSRAVAGGDGADRHRQERSGSQRVPERRAVVAGRRPRHLQADEEQSLEHGAADFSVCRPRGGGEERRSLPRAGPAGLEVGRRRRSRAK